MALTTRTISNTGAPLTDINGAVLADTRIRFTLVNNRSYAGGTFDTETGEPIAPGPFYATTDASGLFNIALWPTSRGLEERFYLVEIAPESDAVEFPPFKAPLADGAGSLPFLSFRLSGDTVQPWEMDAFTAHVQDVSLHTPVGATHNHIVSIAAAESIGGHRVVTMSGVYADCGNPAHGSAIAGISLQAVSAGQSVDAQYLGELEELSWNWIIGQPVYLAALGQLTQTPPATGIIVEIGRPITATKLLIDIQPTLYL